MGKVVAQQVTVDIRGRIAYLTQGPQMHIPPDSGHRLRSIPATRYA